MKWGWCGGGGGARADPFEEDHAKGQTPWYGHLVVATKGADWNAYLFST